MRRHALRACVPIATLALCGGCGGDGSSGGDGAATFADLSVAAPGDGAVPMDASAPVDAEADLAPQPTADLAGPPPGRQRLVGYYESWSEPWVGDGSKARLANVAPYVGVIILSFAQPDARHAPGGGLDGSGLQLPYDAATLKQALAALRARSPETKVLLAVGGATYTNWAGLDGKAIAQLVADFGLDGVDVDYEPVNPACKVVGGRVACATDAEFLAVVKALRAAVPRPLLLSIAAWSTGAYGEGRFAAAPPGGDYTGLSVNLLRAAGGELDFINLMAYDAGNAYSPSQALEAYQALYAGPVMVGVEVPPEAWGGHTTSLDEIDAIAGHVGGMNAGGMMLWSLQKQPNGMASPTNPSAPMIARRICENLFLGGCAQPLY